MNPAIIALSALATIQIVFCLLQTSYLDKATSHLHDGHVNIVRSNRFGPGVERVANGCRVSRFPIELGGKWGYINRRGRIVIGLRYDHAFKFSNGLAAVTENGQVAYINELGRVIIPFGVVPSVESFSEGRAAMPFSKGRGFRWGFVDQKGRVRIAPAYYKASNFVDGLAQVQGQADGGVGFITKTGTLRVPLKYLAAYDFSDGLAAVLTRNGWGFVDSSGHLRIRPQFAAVKSFSEGLAAVEINGLWGFIDSHGRLAVSPQFEDVEPFSEGVAAAKFGTWGFVNKNGKFIIEPSFFAAYRFSDGRALVSKVGFSDLVFNPKRNANVAFVDLTGSLVIPYSFDRALPFDCGLAEVTIVRTSGVELMGYIDSEGRYIWQPST